MRARKSRWLLIPLALSVAGWMFVNRDDAFDTLGPITPESNPSRSYRRFRVAGTEAEAKRRVEAVLAQDGGWHFLSQSTATISSRYTDVFYLYTNDEKGTVQMQYIPAREPDDRVFLDVTAPVGWRRSYVRLLSWRNRHGI